MERKLHFLYICAALLFLASPINAQTTLYDNGFEGTDEDTYSMTDSSGGNIDFTYFAAADYIQRADPTTVTGITIQPTNYSGNIIVWEDFDDYIPGGELRITTDPINIFSYGDIEVTLKVGALNDTSNRYESLDYIIVEYEIDNSGAWTKIGDFRGEPTGAAFNFYEDDDLNGTYTVQTSSNMRTVLYNLDARAGSAITGNTMRVRIRTFSGVQEEMAIDDLKVIGNTFLSTDEFSLEKNLTIFPNPSTNGLFFLKNNNQTPLNTINVYDITGKQVYENTVNNNSLQQEINLTTLNSGMYFIKITDKENNNISKKIVIE